MTSGGGVGTPYSSEQDGDLSESVVKTGALISLGTLATIPRELRDEIYRLVLTVKSNHQACDSSCGVRCPDDPYCCRHYHEDCYYWNKYPPPTENEWTSSTIDEDRKKATSVEKWTGGSLSLLGVSSRIREEALHALGTWGLFFFHGLYLGPEVKQRKLELHDVPFIRVISNLKFRFIIDTYGPLENGGPVLCSTDHEDVEATSALALSLFTGDATQRTICTVEIWYSSSDLTLLLRSPLGKAISQLTGFEDVILVFIYERDLIDIEYDGKQVDYGELEMARFSALTTTFSTALEPDLGPSTSGDIRNCKECRVFDYFYNTLERSIEFHPRTYLSRRHASDESCNR